MSVTGAIQILKERGKGYSFGQTRRLLSDDELIAFKRMNLLQLS